MSSITIHNLDERLNILLRKKAKEDGKSLNKTIQDLLRQSFNLGVVSKSENVFKEFCGLWSEKERREFEGAVSGMETINPGDWE